MSRTEIPQTDPKTRSDTHPDTHPDALTGTPGSHPLGAGVGAAGGAAAGAAVGGVGGPVGAAIGGVTGAVVGGLIGKGIGEAVDPTEDAYWRDIYHERPYYRSTYSYADYEPAYRLGYNAYDTHGADLYDANMEAALAHHYTQRRGDSKLEWNHARHAIRDAYEHRAERLRAQSST